MICSRARNENPDCKWYCADGIGYKGYLGFELCHPLPVDNGRLVGIEFADSDAKLAARSLRETIAVAMKQREG